MPINSFLYPGAKTTPAYEVANSCRFDDGSSAYMHKTPGSAGDQQKFTFSFWIKRCGIATGTAMTIFDTEADDDNQFKIRFNDNGTLTVESKVSDHNDSLITNDLFRDPSAWSNFVIAFDTTQSTDTNRVKIYHNGTQITAFGTANYPAQNLNTLVNAANKLYVGTSAQTDAYCDMYVAEFCLVDGSQLAASSFGEFDEDSPRIWKPKNVSGLTFGTNGFYLDFEDSANLGNDANGGTDLTEVNLAATDQTTDTPTNNFATANPLNVNSGGVSTFAEGNTEVTVNGATGMQFGSSSTIGMTAGKWYCEVKIKTVDSGMVGVSAGASEDARDDYPPGTQGGAESVGILISSGARYIDDSGATHGAATSADGIMMIALDLDNNNVYFGTGGNWFDGSGNADESNPTSAISVTAVGSTTDGAYFFTFGDGGGSSAAKVQWNFGNPPFSISSGNSDANGYGNFEYSVPSGYLSLCTKNLGSDGG